MSMHSGHCYRVIANPDAWADDSMQIAMEKIITGRSTELVKSHWEFAEGT